MKTYDPSVAPTHVAYATLLLLAACNSVTLPVEDGGAPPVDAAPRDAVADVLRADASGEDASLADAEQDVLADAAPTDAATSDTPDTCATVGDPVRWQSLVSARDDGGTLFIEADDTAAFIAGAQSARSFGPGDTGLVRFEHVDSSNHFFVGLGARAAVAAADLPFAIKAEAGELIVHRRGERGEPLGSIARNDYIELRLDEGNIEVLRVSAGECEPLMRERRPVGALSAFVRAAPRWSGNLQFRASMRVEEGPAPIADCHHVSDHFSRAELELYRRRAAGETTHNYVRDGDAAPGSPGEWTRIEAMASDFLEGRDSDDNGWNGPPNGPDGFVNINYDADPYHVFDNVMNAAFYSLVADSAEHRERVADAILAQTDTSRYPGVDFSNRARWRTRAEEPAIQAHHQNPFFFTADFVKKVLHSYEYTSVRLVEGLVEDSDAYTEAEQIQIETWLWNAGDYYRRVVDGYLEEVFFDSRSDRIAGRHNANLSRDPGWTSARLWDGGPRAHNGHLQWQNRITDEVTVFAAIGVFLDDPDMILSARLFFQEVIRYAMQPEGYLGDLYRCEAFGIHYTQGQLAHLIEIADLFARNIDGATGRRLVGDATCDGDTSLYEYETSEGVTMDGDPTSTTVGGPKSLLRGLLAMARFYHEADNPGFTCRGEALDGTGMGDAWTARPHIQHYWTWGQAMLFYRSDALEDFIYGNTDAGYRGWHTDLGRVANNGYVLPSTRGTFSTSVGKLLLYGHTHLEPSVDPFSNR
ncbi:MAG: hypothetical protein AAF938_25355 [Myxococcota bacterium]